MFYRELLDKMPSEKEIQEQLGILFRINGLSASTADLEALIQETRFAEAGEEIQKRLGLIKELATSGSVSGSSSMWHPLESTLSSKEYILPPELEKVHPKVVRDITSGKPIGNLPAGGLLLYGADVGTGKSDYFRFLAPQVGDDARFVVANLDRISGNPNPGTALRTLYLDLDARAKEEGVMYVVFLDEFERMVTKHSTMHSAVKQEVSDLSSAKRMNVHERRETHETLELDDVGASTFATFKTLVSGGENVERVYTVATSNQSAYEAALLRRLSAVQLRSFGMPTFDADRKGNIPDYSAYATRLPRVVEILQAAYVRDEGKQNPHLTRIAGELSSMFEELEAEYTVDQANVRSVKDGIVHTSANTIAAQRAVRNNGYLERLLGYFGVDIEKELEAGWEKFSFAGYFEKPIVGERGDHLKQATYVPFQQTTSEHTLMRGLVPDRIAKLYKDDTKAFENYETAKALLGQAIFPQLKNANEAK